MTGGGHHPGTGAGHPGEVITGAEPVLLNADRPARLLVVVNTGDRPVQVGSHYHLAAANPALRFDRAAAWGHRLDIPAGTAVRFEPGVTREVSVVPLAGRRRVPGLRLDTQSELDGAGGGPPGPAAAGASGMDSAPTRGATTGGAAGAAGVGSASGMDGADAG